MEKLGAAVASLKMGAPEDAATELGPLSSLAHLERVSAAVEAARALPHIKVVTGAVGLTARAITSSRRCSPAPGRKTLLSSAKCLVR
ncbi:aldehyde dehydrogenase family protein [Klebsiella pneumoniae]|nr:aldehyde dehydrogenase family protein [Klebsiella pneumoniae]